MFYLASGDGPSARTSVGRGHRFANQGPTERIRPSFCRMKANNAASDFGEPLTIHTLNFNSAFNGCWLAIVSLPYIGIHMLSAIRFAVSASGTTPASGRTGLCSFRKADNGPKDVTPTAAGSSSIGWVTNSSRITPTLKPN